MRLRAGVLAVTVAALLLPQTAALAHPGHDHDPAAAATDAEALDWANYDRVTLTKNVGEPIGLKVLPDLTVLTTARDGSIRHTDPATGTVNVVAKVPVYNNSEDGLQNIALDPDFENNGWVYMYYAPATMNEEGYPTSTPQGSAPTVLPAGEDEATYWNQWKGYNQLTRAKWDFEARTLDLASEQVILKVGVERGQCCHVGGDIDFDLDGNVLVSTGDNTPASAPGANGFAPNNDAPGMNPGLDARRSAGNSNDLRGSILRVTVAEDGSYTIPEGNLWEEGTENTRPEIFATGLRNPFRMAVDPESGAVTWGDYGPDSGVASAERGPMGYVEWQSTTKALFGGWPYCHGPNANYNNWDFAVPAAGEFFTCETGATNDSRWNTGLETLPPATAPQLYYGDNPGDQPFDELVTFSPSGGQGPMGGPVFHYDETITNPGQLPEYWDGKAFFYEYSQDYVAAISLEGLGTSEGTNWDGAVEKLENFMPNEALETANQPRWSGPIDMEIGPDGAMYVLDYGKGFFRQNPEAGLYRIEYAPGNKAPIALATANPTSSATAPATITFDGAGSSDPEGGALTYAWDFDGDTQTDATTATAQHTFDTTGRYTVTLRVTDPEGKSGVTSIVVTVGNEAPVLTREYPADGGFFTWGDVLPYKFTATDAEDGDVITCNRLNWTFGLGHDSHAHPLQSISRSCEGGLTTPADAVEHGETEKLYGVIVAKYTDAGSASAAAATSEVSSIVNTREQQAEHSNSLTGAERVADDSAQAFQKVVFGESGQLTYDTVNFVNIDGVTARAQGTGTVELRWGAADAAPFATATIAATSGWADAAFTGVNGQPIAFPSGTGALVVTGSAGVQLDSWTVDGAGVTALPPVDPEPEELIEIPAEQVSMQMFALTSWVGQDGLPAVMDRLSTIGFQNIEPFGGTMRGFTAPQFRALTDTYGLNVPSSHYNVAEGTFADTLAYVKTLGQRYTGSGGFASPGISTLENTLATAETMNRLGALSVANGTGKFFGHNHATEFTTIYPAGDHADEALSAWEILVRNTDPELVTFEVDVAWAAHAGVDVVALLEEYGDRIDLLHIKDATGLVTQERPTFVNLGEGDVPLQAILTKAEEVGVDLYVMEYDGSPANEEFAREGFEYLTGLEAGEANPTPAAYPVTAAAVTFTDVEGTTADTYTIPSSGGVEYLVNDAVVRAGTYPGTGTVTVTARATKGFVLAEGSTSTWTFTFTDAVPNVVIPAEQVSMQMFALTNWVNQDGLAPVMDRLSTIGFENIEPFGGTVRGFTAPQFRALTDTYGLNVPSSHYNVAEGTFADTLAYVKTLGQRYVGSGGFAAPGITSLENTLATADTMDRLGALSVANGTGKFFGHNHAGEFTTMYEYEGEMTSAWEILVEETDPELVTFEVDVAWAAHAGVDVPALLEEHGDRIDLLHIKDATGLVTQPRPTFVNLGEGDVPLQEILAEAVEQDVDLFVMEYDGSPANETFAKEGFEYLTGLEAGAANPTPVAYPVTPAAVTFTDVAGTTGDTYTVPNSGGVEYLVGDAVVRAGTYPGTGDVTVTARAAKGFVLVEGSTASWSFSFDAAGDFVDVPEGMLFFEDIQWLFENGISTGWETEDGREYRPFQPIARDAMAAFLYRQANSPEFTEPAVSPFTDVSTDNQFYKEISWLAAEGISTGWANGDGTFSFRPYEPINRDAMAAFLYRMAEEPEFTAPTTSPFTDITPATQFYTEITWLVSEGISTGWLGNDGTAIYRPTVPINRDAMAAFLHRYDDAGFSNVGD